MTARSTYESTFPTANTSLLAAYQLAEGTFNATCDAAKQAYYVAGGTFATYDAAIRAAQKTLVAAKQKAAHDCQQTIQVAKDVLRATGDLAPA